MKRRIVGQYAVETRCNEVEPGLFKSAYIVERLAGFGKRYFVMIALLDTFEDREIAVERAMARGFNHAQWLASSAETATVDE
jgi:hypothetical protein